MNNSNITIVDYGMGNLWSVLSAFRYLGAEPKISADPEDVLHATTLILPGVGSFRKAMDSLRMRGLDQAIIEAVSGKGAKILGICLGMQLMCHSSTEDGSTLGLNLIPAKVDIFNKQEIRGNKVPHVGFDLVKSQAGWPLFDGLSSEADFYFVHSYRLLPEALDGELAICSYGVDFLAAYQRNNIFATQFHPEKSQTNGLLMLKNFMLA